MQKHDVDRTFFVERNGRLKLPYEYISLANTRIKAKIRHPHIILSKKKKYS